MDVNVHLMKWGGTDALSFGFVLRLVLGLCLVCNGFVGVLNNGSIISTKRLLLSSMIFECCFVDLVMVGRIKISTMRRSSTNNRCKNARGEQ